MSISAIDLNLLLVLHTVLVERNVARAAERLHVTPSAVSNSLSRLRDVFGDPLVTRKGRGIVPTPRALELGPGIARAIREIEEALLARSFDPSTSTRTFTLAVADVGQVTWVPRLALSMQREMPLARLRVVGIDALLSLGDLTSSEVDVHVGIAWKAPGIHAEPLFHDRMLLVGRRGHPLFHRKRSKRSLDELRHVRVEMLPQKSYRDPFAESFRSAGIARTVAMIVPSYSAAAAVVSASDLVTMLTASFLEARAPNLDLKPIETPFFRHTVNIAMCWHERTHLDPASRAFRALVKAVVGHHARDI